MQGGLSSEKTLERLATRDETRFNDVDLLIFINADTYSEPVKNEISTAIYNTLQSVTDPKCHQMIVSRGFQKHVLIDFPETRYRYHGSITTIGSRSFSQLIEFEILALGSDPVGNRSPTLRPLCSSSLDSMMIGPLNPIIELIPTCYELQTAIAGTGTPKALSTLIDLLGSGLPHKISKYNYPQSDLDLIETRNVIITPHWNTDHIRVTRFAKQASTYKAMRIGSPLVAESMAAELKFRTPQDFETELTRVIKTHFPNQTHGNDAKFNFLTTLFQLVFALKDSQIGGTIPQSHFLEIQKIITKDLPKKFKDRLPQSQFQFSERASIVTWCNTLALIEQTSPNGQIKRDALSSMDVYLRRTVSDTGIVFPPPIPNVSFEAIELRIITQFQNHPEFVTKMIPALSKIDRSVFSQQFATSYTPLSSGYFKFINWVHTQESPTVIPLYTALLKARMNTLEGDRLVRFVIAPVKSSKR